MKNRLTALVADDQPFVRSIVKEMLLQMGYFDEIEEAEDGLEAWEIIQERHVDLVICDVDMPKLNGIDLLKRANESDMPNTAFIVITGYPSEDVIRDAFAFGAINLLGKPFSFNTLKENIEDVIKAGQTCHGKRGYPFARKMEPILSM